MSPPKQPQPGGEQPARANPSLPVSRGSAVDSELEALMRAHPERTRELLNGLYNIPVPGVSGRKSPALQGPPQPRLALGKTHYQDTYFAKELRKRSSKRPPHPLPGRREVPLAMSFDTSQRADYVTKDLQEARNEPVARKSDSAGGGEGSWLRWRDQQGQQPYGTVYQEELKERPLAPLERPGGGAAVGGRVMVADGRFYGETTTQAEFKGWSGGRNPIRYGELPEFMGSVLNPGNAMDFRTVNQTTYKGPRGVPAPATVPVVGNLTLDGAFDFTTVNRDTYRPMPPGLHRPPPARVSNESVLERKLPMHSETQTRADFKAHAARDYKKSEPAQPPEETLDLRFDSKGYWTTEQKQEFRGVDVRQHPVPASFKKDPSQYTAPEGRMVTETTSHLDFQPKDIQEAFRERVKPPLANTRFAGKFATETTTAAAYRRREGEVTSPRVRHGDFHLGYHNVPKFDRLQGQSETKASFVPKPRVQTEAFKPLDTAVSTEGERDFATVHQTVYRPPKFHLTREQAAAIKAELRRLEGAAHMQQQQMLPGIRG